MEPLGQKQQVSYRLDVLPVTQPTVLKPQSTQFHSTDADHGKSSIVPWSFFIQSLLKKGTLEPV